MTEAPSPNTHQTLFDITGAAEYMSTTGRHVRRLIQERRLAFVKLGSKVRIRQEDLDVFIVQHRVEAVPSEIGICPESECGGGA